MPFISSLESNFLAILQVFVLGCFGFYVMRRGILGQCCLRTISNLVIDVTLPCFIFTNILDHFHAVHSHAWYLFPLYSVAMLGAAALVAALYSRLDPSVRGSREFLAVVTYRNAGFLPLIIVNALVAGPVAERLFVYIFLFIIVFSPLLYSTSGRLFSTSGNQSLARNLLNPATITTAAALGLALAHARFLIPDVLFIPVKMLGNSTIPLSMIVIGGIVMVNTTQRIRFPLGFVLRAALISLVAFPLLVFFIVRALPLSPDVRFLLVLEAMMPPAVTLPLLARRHNADFELTGQALFGITVISLITVPLLLTILDLVPGK